MKTTTVPVTAPKWTIIDADGKNLGRLSAKAAMILRGKHKASFSPHQLCGDHVIIINASKLKFHPVKLQRKQYTTHSGYLGHIRTTSLEKMMEKDPTKVIETAIKGMLSNNRLRNEMLKRLHVFAGADHKHEAQMPTPVTL